MFIERTDVEILSLLEIEYVKKNESIKIEQPVYEESNSVSLIKSRKNSHSMSLMLMKTTLISS